MKFVYPEFSPHKPYRELTKTKEIVVETSRDGQQYVYYDLKNIPESVVFPDGTPDFAKNSQAQTDSWFVRTCGINLANYYRMAAYGFPSEGFRMERHPHDSRFPTALEVLTYGIGLLRYKKTPIGGFYYLLGAGIPRLAPHGEQVIMTHVVPGHQSDTERPWMEERFVFDSTNILLADSYGEIEQLYDRKSDRKFMEAYLDYLTGETGPAPKIPQFLKYRGLFTGTWMTHSTRGIWNELPSTTDELVRRVEFILENTEIDANPNIRWEIIPQKIDL